jgi:hypothetical protein
MLLPIQLRISKSKKHFHYTKIPKIPVRLAAILDNIPQLEYNVFKQKERL